MPGFPARMDYTSLPSPFLGALLQEMEDLAELKCALRIFWHVHRKKGSLKAVSLEDLVGDSVIVGALAWATPIHRGHPEEPNPPSHLSSPDLSPMPSGDRIAFDSVPASSGDSESHPHPSPLPSRERELEQGDVGEAFSRVMERLVERGTFVVLAPDDEQGQRVVALNTPQNRAKAEALGLRPADVGTVGGARESSVVAERPNIFQLYEANIGLLTPLIAEELKEAEASYPEPWIQEAFQEAVERNKRSWRYIARILERWAQEGKDDGEPGRHSEAIGAGEYIRRYGAPWRR